MNAIELDDVWLRYRIQFKENGLSTIENFWALKAIHLRVAIGESVCIIGENGAGKTSLFKIIAGMLKADKGTVQVNGTVSGLMEIGAGFEREMTGKENVYLVSSLYGLSPREVDARYNAITEFAGIGRFINAPVKSYSQGMLMRLGFAIAAHIDPDILLIDDSYVVGDRYAQEKCVNKISELKKQGKTILFITHDLEMAKRVCSRGLFLRDGAIIKDSSATTVCEYYTETVGDKRGIAILQQGLLGLVFNNGKLILRWDTHTLTSDVGGYSKLLVGGREYFSYMADWHFEQPKNSSEIRAVGSWRDSALVLQWKIALRSEKELVWEIGVRGAETLLPERHETIIQLQELFKKWFTHQYAKDFPVEFYQKEEWACDIVDNALSGAIGIRTGDDGAIDFPEVVFDRSQDMLDAVCFIGNAGLGTRCRILQYRFLPHNSDLERSSGFLRCFAARVCFFTAQEQEELRLYLVQAKQTLQESKIVKKGSLSLLCREKSIQIFWNGQLVSGGMGLNTIFKCQDINCSAMDGHWVIQKISESEISINISWVPSLGTESFPWKQIWRLRLEEGGILAWEIEMELREKARIRSKETECILRGTYQQYIAQGVRGRLDRLDSFGSLILERHNNRYIGLENSLSLQDAEKIQVLFTHEDSMPKASYIVKTHEKESSVILRYWEIDSEETLYLPPGTHRYFKGSIKINSSSEEQAVMQQPLDSFVPLGDSDDVSGALKSKALELRFCNGRGRIVFDGRELTSGLCAYSALLFEGHWHDSTQASWSLRELDKTRLVAIGRWPGVPLQQAWEFSLFDGNTLTWKIEESLWEPIDLEREQISIMLSQEYDQWFVENGPCGAFPLSFRKHNGLFWDRFWCGDIGAAIGVRSRRSKKGFFRKPAFPAVVFEASPAGQAHYFVIENSDDLFQGRILQCEMDSGRREGKIKGRYFEGKIRVVI